MNTVRNDIPFPKGAGRPILYVFDDLLSTGDSKFFDCKPQQSREDLQSRLHTLVKKRKGLGFRIKTSMRIENGIEGVRVWRL